MHRVTKFPLIAGLLLLSCGLHAGTPQANIPDWMKELASQPVGSYPPRTNAVVLLDEKTLSVTGPAEYTETHRRVVRILRPEGRNEGRFAVEYGQGDKVLNTHIWSIDSTGHQYEIKDKDFVDHGDWGDELYNDVRARAAEAPASGVGSVVAIESSVRRRLWIAQPTWFFQEDVPVKEARFTIELPAGWEYKSFWVNASQLEPAQLGPNKWQWLRKDVPGIVKEERRPNRFALSGRMELAYFAPGNSVPAASSWNSIGNWYNGLTADRRNPTTEIQAEVQRLTAGVSSFDGIVRVLASFLQTEIRYVAVEIGIGGYQPHSASDTFKHRYGDCKDKATLLGTMLKVAGIRSYYVVIHTRHGIARADAPALTFNHMILAIELPKDAPAYRSVVTAKDGRKLLIFDATDTYTPVGELRGDLQGNVGLLVTETGGEAITLPLLDPTSNIVTRDGRFNLNPDGTLTGEIVEKRTGDNGSEIRAALKRSSESERTQFLERYFGHFLNGATINESKIENLAQLNQELILRYKITSGKYSQNAGPLILIRPRVMGEKGFALDWKDRKYSVELDAPTFQSDTFEIRIPDDFVVDDVPEAAQIDVGFASYKSSIEVAGSTVRYHREYVVKDPQVPLAKLADLKRLEQAIGRDENASVVLKRK